MLPGSLGIDKHTSVQVCSNSTSVCRPFTNWLSGYHKGVSRFLQGTIFKLLRRSARCHPPPDVESGFRCYALVLIVGAIV